MFSANKKEANRSNNGSNSTLSVGPNSINSLVKGTEVKGDISSQSDIRIDGLIDGSLNCKAKVIIGPEGRIKGRINCVSAVIEGQFEGNLHVQDLLVVRDSAVITGEVQTGKLNVSAGAIFNVTCMMTGTKTASHANGASNGKSNGVSVAKAPTANAKV